MSFPSTSQLEQCQETGFIPIVCNECDERVSRCKCECDECGEYREECECE